MIADHWTPHLLWAPQLTTLNQHWAADRADLLWSAHLLRGSQDQPSDQPGAVTPATGRS